MKITDVEAMVLEAPSAGEHHAAEKLLLLLFGTHGPLGTIATHVELPERWRDDESEPESRRSATRSILATDPLAAIGL